MHGSDGKKGQFNASCDRSRPRQKTRIQWARLPPRKIVLTVKRAPAVPLGNYRACVERCARRLAASSSSSSSERSGDRSWKSPVETKRNNGRAERRGDRDRMPVEKGREQEKGIEFVNECRRNRAIRNQLVNEAEALPSIYHSFAVTVRHDISSISRRSISIVRDNYRWSPITSR